MPVARAYRPASSSWAWLLAGGAAAFMMASSFAVRAAAMPATDGERIYRQGMLPSGIALVGERDAGVRVEGADAACVNCHRRSGLGTLEGNIVVPPITGEYLFRPVGRQLGDVDVLRYGQGYAFDRSPYSEAALARAIRDGVGQNGRKLNYLMPRYRIDDEALASLTSYLKGLSAGPVPGVTDDTLHFATIITPDADPLKAGGMLDVLQRFFADKNEFIRGGGKPMKSPLGVHYRVTRKWQLHVWRLSGAPGTWQRQLQQHLREEPVFAVISGIGGKTWEPVHRFCEKESIPCLFPNVDLPVVAEKDFYSLYFSKGVLLEAELIAGRLERLRRNHALNRVIQVAREDDMGVAAAGAVRADAALAGVAIETRLLKADAPPTQLAAALKDAGPGDALVLWLRPGDLAALPEKAERAAIFVSGVMGGFENAPLPAGWRRVAELSYPLDLPEQRKIRMFYPLGWFKIEHIPVVDERVQSDTYLACGILAENLTFMLDSFVRDYLVERIETMLSERVLTGEYPRLGLAPGQRFASKGGFMVHFADASGNKLVPDGGWTIP